MEFLKGLIKDARVKTAAIAFGGAVLAYLGQWFGILPGAL